MDAVVVLTVLAAFAGVVWIAHGLRRDDTPPGSRLNEVALKLVLLSYLQFGTGSTARIVLLGAALLCSAIVSVRFGRIRLHVSVWMWLYVLAAMISALLSSNQALAFEAALKIALVLAAVSTAAAWVDGDRIRRIFWEFFVGAALHTAFDALTNTDGAFREIRAPLLTFMWEGSSAVRGALIVGFTGLVLASGIGLSWVRRRRGAYVEIPLFLLGLALLVVSQRRMLYVVAVAAFVTVIVGTFKGRTRIVALALPPVMFGLLVAVASPSLLLDRESVHPEASNATSYRVELFDASIERFLERPVFGGGIRVGDSNLKIELGKDDRAWRGHDELSSALAATGIVGAITLLGAHVSAFRVAFAKRRTDIIPLMTAIGLIALTPFFRSLGLGTVTITPYLFFVLPLYGTVERNLTRLDTSLLGKAR